MLLTPSREAPIASSLLGHFVSAVSGGSLYRKASFLTDSLGKQAFSPLVHLREDLVYRKPLGAMMSNVKGGIRE